MDGPTRNHLLARLLPEERAKILRDAQLVPLAFKEMLFEQDRPVTQVYFVESGVASVVTALQEASDIVETGTIGREGFVGLPVFLHAPIATARCFMQVVGSGYRMEAAAFTAALAEIPRLSLLLMAFTNAFMTMIAQTAACNRMHVVESRLARWLLITHDRVDSDEFPLTQEFLAQMLGVRRPAVSIAGATLQKAGMIRYTRGKIAVLDREALQDASCECYAHVKKVYDHAFDAG